jgi:hypothetical protein
MNRSPEPSMSPASATQPFHFASRWFALLGLLALAGGCDLSGNAQREHLETGPDDVSVVPEMLVGARYRGRTGGDEYDDLTWVFDNTHFRIVAGKRGLPADLVTALLPADMTGHRIDGRWSVEGEVLTVTELALDGEPIDQAPLTLQAMCTPVIRIQADNHQYMFARGTAESARSQGDIPTWPQGTTRVSGSVTFDRREEGWLSVGYYGVTEAESIRDSATLNWEPDDSGFGSAQTRTYAPRFCRLQLNGGDPATLRCMALPPGAYLFYAMWKPELPEHEGKIVVTSERWRLRNPFRAKWVVVEDQPLSHVDFDLVNAAHGEIEVRISASDSRQSVFLLPWGQPDTDPPPLDNNQAWQIAHWAGHQVSVEAKRATFPMIPAGRYRLFLVEHDRPAEEDDTFVEYRVLSDTIVTVRADAVVEASF